MSGEGFMHVQGQKRPRSRVSLRGPQQLPPTPRRFKILSAGQNPLSADCTRFSATNTASSSHQGPTNWERVRLIRIRLPARTRMADSMVIGRFTCLCACESQAIVEGFGIRLAHSRSTRALGAPPASPRANGSPRLIGLHRRRHGTMVCHRFSRWHNRCVGVGGGSQ